jgi:ABC-type iron transport system FetAB permease component
MRVPLFRWQHRLHRWTSHALLLPRHGPARRDGVAVAARLALDTLKLRAGEVEAALSLGLSERDSRMEIIGRSATNALLPNLDSTRTVGFVTLPGAFVGVLLSTGSAAQAGAVQILVLIALLLCVPTCSTPTDGR